MLALKVWSILPSCPSCIACPFPGNVILWVAMTYRTVPPNDHPGIVLFSFNRRNGVVEFSVRFAGGVSKSEFCRRSVNGGNYVRNKSYKKKLVIKCLVED